jgi:serine/threonine-protein kinase
MLVGKQIGPFAIEKELGSGAMGTVYRARHLEAGLHVAIKVMAPGLTSETAQKRFQREAAILKDLKHPNIVRLLASGRFNKCPFYAMEYIQGESLDHVLLRRGRLTWEEVVTLGEQLCAGLQHAHEKGIIHRDLKPSNLMVLADGTVKLTDFGIAKDLDGTQYTNTNSTVGTASYMSPEQCRGVKDLTSKSDLYSLGVMFYELLTGRKPFMAESIMDMFKLHNEGTFERPSRVVLEIPVWLDTLVCQLLEKEPEKRPMNAATVAQALSRVKEKVEAQQSAGMEAATKRRADRTGHEIKLDETDKEAARTLLNKKKKKRTDPFYTRGWFQGLALSAVLGGMAFVVYLVFIKPPSPESLLREMETLLKSPDIADHVRARREPVKTFLALYPNHKEADKVRRRSDDVHRDDVETQWLNRRRQGYDSDDEGEKLFRQATDEENAGKLADAAKSWQELAAYKNKGDEERSWGLVAESHLKELQAVEDLYRKLQERAQAEKAPKKGDPDPPPSQQGAEESKEEQLALKAVRSEVANKMPEALALWEELRGAKGEASQSQAQRRWQLLALKRVRDLKVAAK